ncbi:hypothetical protein B7463_g1489, partial [Scytalidium lignicola]
MKQILWYKERRRPRAREEDEDGDEDEDEDGIKVSGRRRAGGSGFEDILSFQRKATPVALALALDAGSQRKAKNSTLVGGGLAQLVGRWGQGRLAAAARLGPFSLSSLFVSSHHPCQLRLHNRASATLRLKILSCGHGGWCGDRADQRQALLLLRARCCCNRGAASIAQIVHRIDFVLLDYTVTSALLRGFGLVICSKSCSILYSREGRAEFGPNPSCTYPPPALGNQALIPGVPCALSFLAWATTKYQDKSTVMEKDI